MDRRSFIRLVASTSMLGLLPGFDAGAVAAGEVEVPSNEPGDVAKPGQAGFVHLRVHTQYSIGRSTIKPGPLMSRLATLGMTSVAITDRGNLFGAIDFYKSAVGAGIKPILGCELYVTPGRRENWSGAHRGAYLLTLLAMTFEGYKNLCNLVTAAGAKGFQHRARIDEDLLRSLNSGIIALSGFAESELVTSLARGNPRRAHEVMEQYASIFDGRYYVEIQDNDSGAQNVWNRHLVQMACELGLPVVATNDCHYLEKKDALAQEILSRARLGDRRPFDRVAWDLRMHELYVKSPEEMAAVFSGWPEAVANTLEVANRCDVELRFGPPRIAVFQTSNYESADDCLRRLVVAAVQKRVAALRARPDWYYPGREDEYQARLCSELTVIRERCCADYFLVVADYVGEAKRRGIPVGPGRGAIGGSLVAFCLGITDVDPMQHGLLFERFLNPERKLTLYMEVEFCADRRDELFDYVSEKYGRDRVAGVLTFATLNGKAALETAGRALGFTSAERRRAAKVYPTLRGWDPPLDRALDVSPELRAFRDRGDRERELFDTALGLEHTLQHASQDASRIVISNRPLVEELPLCTGPRDVPITQYENHHVEAVGLFTFNLLGRTELTLLESARRRIRKRRGIDIDLTSLRLDDEKTFELLSRGDTLGVWPINSSTTRELWNAAEPTCFEDVAALEALCRPWPLELKMDRVFIERKHGRQPIPERHPALEPIFRETYGLLVYQEQMMRITQVLAGYGLGEADNLRRTLLKKNVDELRRERDRFINTSLRRSASFQRKFTQTMVAEIFAEMEEFVPISFNKAHAVARALLSYEGAYLRAHYPEEFAHALRAL